MRGVKIKYYYKHKVDKDVQSEIFSLEDIESEKWINPKYYLNDDGYEFIGRELYTGMKDNTDQEIYNRDKVKVIVDGFEESIHEIEWGGEDYPAFDLVPMLDTEVNGLSAISNSPYYEIEVIGHKYE